MTQEKLKPCPCCSHDAELIPHQAVGVRYYVQCSACGLRTGHFAKEDDASECWNTRPLSAQDKALREAVIEECAKVAEEWDELSPYSSRSQAIRALARIDQAGEAK